MSLRSESTTGRTRHTGRVLVNALALLAVVVLSGCRSAYVQADILNTAGQPISLLEVDYPSASFGTEALPAGAYYHYRFKILGSGPTKVLWTDAHHQDHSVSGPALHEGQHGTLQIVITASGATWTAHVQP